MNALITRSAAELMLAEANTVLDVKNVRDKAEALRTYARMAQDREGELTAAEIRVRAERRLGEMLLELNLQAGRPPRNGSPAEPFASAATLAELGVDKKLSMRAQDLARVPLREFERRVAAWREEEKARTSRAIASLFKAAARPAAPARAPAMPEGKYRVLYADPPWRFESWSPAGMDRSAGNHYPTMTTDEICALPIDDIAADDCVLLIWGIGPMLPDTFRVIEAWGFTYKTLGFTWVKTNAGVDAVTLEGEGAFSGNGYWSRANPEPCLLATRGKISRREGATDVDQLVIAPRGRHSEKPEEVARRIERLVEGPYIELFARTEREGWDNWGHKVGGAS